MIKPILVEQTYTLRHHLLVPHLTLADCCLPGDEEEDTQHFGAFQSNLLVGIVSVYALAHPSFKDIAPYSWQLRAIAVVPEWRQHGIGKALIDVSMQYCREQHGQRIWCHAREPVLDFYGHLGWRQQGERFVIPKIGPHYMMLNDL